MHDLFNSGIRATFGCLFPKKNKEQIFKIEEFLKEIQAMGKRIEGPPPSIPPESASNVGPTDAAKPKSTTPESSSSPEAAAKIVAGAAGAAASAAATAAVAAGIRRAELDQAAGASDAKKGEAPKGGTVGEAAKAGAPAGADAKKVELKAPSTEEKKEIQTAIDKGIEAGKKADTEQAALDKKIKAEHRAPTAEETKKISDLRELEAKEKKKAVDLAIKYYNIDTSKAAGGVKYDKTVSGEGASNREKRDVRIGDEAFVFKGKVSPEWLASSIYHETVHTVQNSDPKTVEKKGKSADARRAGEYEAYDAEIKAASKTGVSDKMIDELKARRKKELDGMSEANKKKALAGDYKNIE